MGAQRTTFNKLQRDRAKKAKAAAKRERRQGRVPAEDTGASMIDLTSGEGGSVGGGELSPAELLHSVEVIHRRLESGEITYEDFEEQKNELLSRLPVD